MPGSEGEHILQERLGTAGRAGQFYSKQVVDYLTPIMAEFIGRMEMAFIATSDPDGECDCSFRAGAPGFIRVIDEQTIAYPELRGNGVMASMGNMLQNPHIGIFLPDFTRDLVGLHINGDAAIVPPARMLEFNIEIDESENAGKKPVQWVLVHVTEAYIHCSKHMPLMIPQSRVRHWGTDNPRHKGGDYFGVTAMKAEAGLIEPRRRNPHLAAANGSAPPAVVNGSAAPTAARGLSSVPVASVPVASVPVIDVSALTPVARGSALPTPSSGPDPIPGINDPARAMAMTASAPQANDSTPRPGASSSVSSPQVSGSALRPQCKGAASHSRAYARAGRSVSPTSNGSVSPDP